ncbi:MAG: hypothetical protein GEU95_01165 [Rhizobiales bacterium]|nr:hypothetical protein [Hyphomicrobiales bacterium]
MDASPLNASTRDRMSPLANAKREAFARAIVEGKSGREAYRSAGYKPKNDATADACASRLLAEPAVAARVTVLKEAAADDSVMSAREVLEELSKLGRSSIKNCIVNGDDAGEVIASLSDMPDEVAATIQEMTVETYTEGRGDNARGVKRVRLKLHSKTSALDLLGKHYKLFTEKHEHDLSDPLKQLLADISGTAFRPSDGDGK